MEKTHTLAESEIVPPEFADDALALDFSKKRSAMCSAMWTLWGRWMVWDGTVQGGYTLRVYDLVRGMPPGKRRGQAAEPSV